MKPSVSLTIVSLLLVVSFVAIFKISWPFTPQILPVAIISLLPWCLNTWLVPGGFAWRNYPSRSSQNIKGPVGLPLLGTIPHMGSLAHRKLAEMASKLDSARLMAFSLGTTPVIISSHPETAKEILCGTYFSNRPMKESARLLMFERAIGFAPSGKYWRHLRRISVSCMFSPKRISSHEGLRKRISDQMVLKIENEMEERGVVSVRKILHEGALCNIVESVFGGDLGLKGEELALMVKEGYDLIVEFNLGDYFPIRYLDFYGVKRRCNELAIRVRDFVGEIINERKEEIGFSKGRNDFLSLLLCLPKEDQLSDLDIVAVLWEMIFRGTDTVAILLEWILARMAKHQDIQAKVQEEIDACVGHSRLVLDSDIPKLPYLQAIVKETLRMHPPGPLLSWARLATQDCQVGDFFIPAGTTAMVNMWAIAHNPSTWPDPWAFKPERFMDIEFLVMGSDLRLAPFGAGRRVCPGRVMGLATVHLWLARFLQKFKWAPIQPVDLSECLRLSLEMKKPLDCQVTSRC